jgi:hypothetical protein
MSLPRDLSEICFIETNEAVLEHAIQQVVLMAVGMDMRAHLSSSQSKGEKVFHRGTLDHPGLLDVEMQRQGHP